MLQKRHTTVADNTVIRANATIAEPNTVPQTIVCYHISIYKSMKVHSDTFPSWVLHGHDRCQPEGFIAYHLTQ
jgi:hypothetical protein